MAATILDTLLSRHPEVAAASIDDAICAVATQTAEQSYSPGGVIPQLAGAPGVGTRDDREPLLRVVVADSCG
jgi:acetyl-CoA acetyltransferase